MSAAPSPRVLFLADAGPESGGGRVMRCLTLARALVERGAECAFVESRAAAPILRRFGWPPQTFLAMVAAESLPDLVAWGLRFADMFEADVVVVDHPGAGAAEENRLRGASRRIAVIDDVADRPHDCEVLIDPGFGRRRDDYAGLVDARCAILTGPDHALVRPGFAQARPRALSRRARHDPVRRALVAFGLTDAGRVTERAVRVIAGQLGDIRLDLVVSPDAQGLDVVAGLAQRNRRIHLHNDVADIAALGVEADIAVGGGGTSVWERACLGLPSATAILSDTQARGVARLGADGATIPLDARTPGFETMLADAWRRLVDDRELRWDLCQRSAELCDGRGAQRVADVITDLLR